MGTENAQAIEVRRLQHDDGWEVRVYLMTHEVGSVTGHAEISLHGDYKCRIVLAGAADDEESAIDALALKAINWIDDWQRRAHSGSTGFADI